MRHTVDIAQRLSNLICYRLYFCNEGLWVNNDEISKLPDYKSCSDVSHFRTFEQSYDCEQVSEQSYYHDESGDNGSEGQETRGEPVIKKKTI